MKLTRNRYTRKTSYKSSFDPQREVWRRAVLNRDGWKCLKCGCKSKRNLNVHHIRPWAKFPCLRYDINNGICVCKKCHLVMKGNEEAWARMCYTLIAGAVVSARLGKALHDLKEEEENEKD